MWQQECLKLAFTSTSISRRSWYFSHWNSIQLETRRNVKSIAKSILKRSSIKLFSDLNSVHHLLVLVYILLWYTMGLFLEISNFLLINEYEYFLGYLKLIRNEIAFGSKVWLARLSIDLVLEKMAAGGRG